jgi:hypothetical protein
MKKLISGFLLSICLLFGCGCDYLNKFVYTKDIAVTDFEFDYTYTKGESIMVDIVALCDMVDVCFRVEFYSSDNPDLHSEGGGAYNLDLSKGESFDYGGYSFSDGKEYDAARLIIISGKKK